MSESRRAKRMSRHHARTKRNAGLNMVSLMDIFTILVFFLLVSSTSVQDVPKNIKLPESVAEQMPKETVVVMVDKDNLLVQGKAVEKLKNIVSSPDKEIPGLRAALKEQVKLRLSSSSAPPPDPKKPIARPVTIMSDKKIPYMILKKIMYTCTTESFSRISLAVLKKNKTS